LLFERLKITKDLRIRNEPVVCAKETEHILLNQSTKKLKDRKTENWNQDTRLKIED